MFLSRKQEEFKLNKLMGNIRKKAKGPNPLSVKKKNSYYVQKEKDLEDEKKDKTTNDINNNKRIKKKYFRIEKSKCHASKLKDKESKKIFKTQKEYHLSKRKIFRESRRLKFHKSKKFITITKDNSNIQYDKDNNSFIVRKIIPKKIKFFKKLIN